MPVWIKVSIPLTILLMSSLILLWIDAKVSPGAMLFLLVFTAVLIFATRKVLAPLDMITEQLEDLAKGNLNHRPAHNTSKDEFGRLDRAASDLTRKLSELSGQADQLARGDIQMVTIEDDALSITRLSDVDMDIRKAQGDLGRSFAALTNQLRRLTLQARVIANDQLDNDMLSERVQGELGDAFSLMVSNLRELSERAKNIANGDLTSTSNRSGDLNSAFDTMVTSIKAIVEEIIKNTMHFSSSAEEILAVLRDQEFAASHQASSVEETQRTMETLLSSAKKIAESAQTVFKSAERTQANNRLIADRSAELKSHTERIGDLLESIKEIADRSDLLALNASLEGLRAGEAGKGFTLVAGEMRRLAENIKGSVGDIKELLSDIRESALSSVMAIEEGTRLSERTTDSALKITLITQQQQSGTEQVTQSMEELSHLINQGVAGTQQVITAANELSELSERMRQLVDSFDIGKSVAHPKPKRVPIQRTPLTTLPGTKKPKVLDAPATTRTPSRQTQATPVHTISEVIQEQSVKEKDPMRQTTQINISSLQKLNNPDHDEDDPLEQPASPTINRNRLNADIVDATPTIDISSFADDELFLPHALPKSKSSADAKKKNNDTHEED